MLFSNRQKKTRTNTHWKCPRRRGRGEKGDGEREREREGRRERRGGVALRCVFVAGREGGCGVWMVGGRRCGRVDGWVGGGVGRAAAGRRRGSGARSDTCTVQRTFETSAGYGESC